MSNGALVLRDIHITPAPGWWPPAPGWWMVAVLVLAGVALAVFWQMRSRRRKRAIAQLFDRRIDAAGSPAEQVAAMSELLRRAGRQRDPSADRLQGEAWLAFLDDVPQRKSRRSPRPRRAFTEGAGRLLLDGAFRRDVDGADVEVLRGLARERFLQWMGVS